MFPFLIIKLLCWTLHAVTGTFKLNKASKAGSTAVVTYKEGKNATSVCPLHTVRT
jgi:hypothetical protein